MVRDALRQAAALTSYPLISWFCEKSDCKLATGVDNLIKFAAGNGYNPDDFDRLCCFLYDTPIGRLLRNRSPGYNLNFETLVHILRTGVRHQSRIRIEGSYFLLHGSHTYRGHFVQLACKFTICDNDCIEIEIRYRDNKSIVPIDRKAFGLLIFSEGRPHIITFNEDNSRGLELIIVDQVFPDTGPNQHITGQLLGMTVNGLPYSRVAYLRQTPIPLTFDEMLPHTGIKPFGEWPPDVQASLNDLARRPPRQAFPDPISELS